MKENPCTRVATVKSANISSATVHDFTKAKGSGKLTPWGKKISNECLKKIEPEDSNTDDDVERDGILKDEDYDLFECEDLPMFKTLAKNSRPLKKS